MQAQKPTLKKHYPTQGLVAPLQAGSVLRFMADPFPVLDCSLNPTWPYGYSSIPGVLDGMVTDVVDGRTLVRFNMGVFNSSLDQPFTIPNTPENIDEHGDVKEFWQAELLDQNGNHLQWAGGKQFMRFSCVECRPVSCGYPPSEKYLTLAPQWADIYPANMNDQWFDMTGLPTGRYIIRYIIDPNDKYGIRGEYQPYQYDRIWDGASMLPR